MRLLFFGRKWQSESLEQGGASLQTVAPRSVEVVGVPWVGHVAGTVGIVQEEVNLAIGVAAAHTQHVTEVVLVHADEEVVVVVVAATQLSGGLAGTGDAVLRQLTASRWIDRIANLLGTGGGRGYLELVGEASLLDEVLHDKLSHGTAADIAVTNK